MKTLITSSLIATSLLLGSSFVGVVPNVDFAKAHAEQKRKRTPSLNSRVYSQLARAQQLADGGDVKGGLEVLDSVKAKSGSLNSYETAMMYNFYGFIYYNAEQMTEAMAAFEQVVAQDPIPESLEKSTLFSLAQLAMANEEYSKTISFLERWESINEGDIPVKNNVLKAQASYQGKDYQNAAQYIDLALAEAKEQEVEPKENWFVLQRAAYFELKQPKKVASILEEMVRRFNKPEYWVQLAGMYGEIGAEDKQLAVLEAAYQQGYISKQSDFRNLAQIYYFNGLPYKAASVMEQGINQKVLTKNVKNVKFLSQAWITAKELDKAVETLEVLSTLENNGTAHQQIAEIRLQQGKYKDVIEAAFEAEKRGDLTNPGNLYLALGMAHFNLKEFEAAIEALNMASEYKNVQRMATQWLKFVEKEKSTMEQLAFNY
ncbi:hypothetical protein N9W11_06505 [Psychrosphaera haliotis]|nr:hypothetical protein [Psychrosphaera haliotis]